jgi:hypothetical protein
MIGMNHEDTKITKKHTRKALLRFSLCSSCLCGSMLSPSIAQTSYPMITQVFPAGIRRGETAQVTVSGQRNFAGAYKVLFQGEGLSAEIVPPEKDADPKTPVNSVTLQVTAAADAPPGVRELRVATPRGVSSVGLLVVSDEPEIVETEPNNEPEAAQKITLPVTINGRLQASEDTDRFRFTARAGEEVTFSVLAMRLQDRIHDLQEHVDPLLVLRDATGRELARADDTYGGDPLLIHRFAEGGEFEIEIRDVRYAGNPNWVYRLTATGRPWVTAALPLAVRRGDTATLRLVGANLGERAAASWSAPADSAPGMREVSLHVGDGFSNPVPLVVSDLPELVEPGAETAAPLPLPCGVNGRIGAAGEVDRYPFQATKGNLYVFEVHARRLGSALDSYLAVLDAAGKEVAANDDADGSPDSRLEWTAPADGEYTIAVRDLNGRGGPEFVYRLVARPARPDFSLRVDGDKAQIGPGGGTAWYARVTRREGFTGEVALTVRGLPPAVTALCPVIPSTMTEGCILLTAATGAKIDAVPVEVVGTASLPDGSGGSVPTTRLATPIQEIYTPGGGRGLFPVALHVVSVTEPQEITVSATPQHLTLAPGGTARIDVTLQRREGFTKGVTLDLLLRHLGSVYGNPLPPGVTLVEDESKTLLGESETQGHFLLRAAPDAKPVTDLPIAVLGQVSINFVVKVSYATPVTLTLTPTTAAAP